MQALWPVRGRFAGAIAVVLCLCFSPAPVLVEGHSKILWTESGSAAKVSVDKDVAAHLPPVVHLLPGNGPDPNLSAVWRTSDSTTAGRLANNITIPEVACLIYRPKL